MIIETVLLTAFSNTCTFGGTENANGSLNTNGWIGINSEVILALLLVAGFVYMLSNLFPAITREKLKGACKYEIFQGFLSVFLILALIAFSLVTCSIGDTLTSSATYVTSGIAYLSSFNISSYGSSATYLGNNDILYSTNLSYFGPNNNSAYVLIDAAYNYTTDRYFGLYNYSLFNGSVKCSSYPCTINTNRIVISNTADYKLNATINVNTTGPVYIVALIYNKNHFYKTQTVVYK